MIPGRGSSGGADEAPRFIIGIDLGTTNSALAYVDTQASSNPRKDVDGEEVADGSDAPGSTRNGAGITADGRTADGPTADGRTANGPTADGRTAGGTTADVRTANGPPPPGAEADGGSPVSVFLIPQLVAPGTIESRTTLPSFHYVPAAGEFGGNSLELPWGLPDPVRIVGTMARDHGRQVHGRQVASAKSWLSHAGVDRTAALLPWQGAADVERISPVEVSARYLAHLRAAWNHEFPEYPMETQDVVIGVPASFDEVARELTVEAAAEAGLPRLVLLEEPQAAFYAWLRNHEEHWRDVLSPGQIVAICDIGGGTTDFTLIEARDDPQGRLQLHRIAVGDHLILGGDNLDLALAHRVEEKLGEPVPPSQWELLVRRCQHAKETLLGEGMPGRVSIHVPGAGAKLLAGGRQVEIDRAEALELLVDGFLPRVGREERPQKHASGFREFGLPYAPDAAITRYLAGFLEVHADSGPSGESRPARGRATLRRPDVILFNGGFFASRDLRERFLEVLSSWFEVDLPGWRPKVLDNADLSLAVAEGAAYYGRSKRGRGERIQGGLARTFYVGVDAGEGVGARACCLLPAGTEEGGSVVLPDIAFELLIRQPVEFPIYTSGFVTTDRPGDLVEVDPARLTALPPIRTLLRSGKKRVAGSARVHLHAKLTEIGTLEIWCAEIDGNRTWRLQFDVRSATQTDVGAHEGTAEAAGFVDEETTELCRSLVADTFRKADAPERLVKRLEEVSGMKRSEWPPAFLRSIWEVLLDVEPSRRIKATVEARWLNLLGFCLRPGFGFALDDWRVSQTWSRLVSSKLAFGGNELNRAEWWILWRRLSGGLTANQQRMLADPILSRMNSAAKSGKGVLLEKTGSHETAEVWRLLASLERLDLQTKIRLGDRAAEALATRGEKAWSRSAAWGLGRIGARVPVYCALSNLVPTEVAERWLDVLLELETPSDSAIFSVVLLSRRTGDRFRDLPVGTRTRVLSSLEAWGAPERYLRLVETGGDLEGEEQSVAVGESLPPGLRIG